MDNLIKLVHGDCRTVLPTLPRKSVQCIVTSPPYFGLRQYGDDPREIGREQTPAEYVAAMVEVFRLCRDVLADDGVLWLNVGDSYANDAKWGGASGGKHQQGLHGQTGVGRSKRATGLGEKQLIGIPWRLAFGLQDDGWILRADVIWHKPSAMPESVKDRPTRDHEYLFLFSKRPRYFYDAEAIAEPTTGTTPPSAASFKRDGNKRSASLVPGAPATHRADRPDVLYNGAARNRRTVWSIPAQPLADEHYAPMPERLAELCILAGSRAGDTVLDPFGGSGTTGRAAIKHNRRAVLIELYSKHLDISERRTDGVQQVLI